MKYSNLLCKWLKDLGYTHCFTLQGGGIMHLINSAAEYFTIVPVVHEVAAVIGAEYFNATETEGKKAFALVTTGPGFTNTITGVAAAFLESRELLIIGGQVKTADKATDGIRQCGIQEIDGVSIAKSITKLAIRLEKAEKQSQIYDYVAISATPRKGPVFIEIPLDIQGCNVDETELSDTDRLIINRVKTTTDTDLLQVIELFKNAKRPGILIGGGVSKNIRNKIENLLNKQSFPVFTTWNGADLLPSDHRLYFGRPNTFGMRYANILQQQCDLLIAIGTRLGMQQTGFNYQKFMPNGKIVQVDCDLPELQKKNPGIDYPILADANDFILRLLSQDLGNFNDWLEFCQQVKKKLPLNEHHNNTTNEGFLSPYEFYEKIARFTKEGDNIIPCSSGGAYTCFQQAMLLKKNQITISNKGSASMGYGLAGGIGSAIARPDVTTFLFEGDGGFAQNMQEIGTLMVSNLNIKMFIFNDNGYASIRMTQKNYFGGKYIGCDVETKVGIPNYSKIFDSYSIPNIKITKGFESDQNFIDLINKNGAAAFILSIDPKQTYFPKITSRQVANGSMESDPIHLMSPYLPEDLSRSVLRYIE